jgi:hypothetical protein
MVINLLQVIACFNIHKNKYMGESRNDHPDFSQGVTLTAVPRDVGRKYCFGNNFYIAKHNSRKKKRFPKKADWE